MSTIQYCTKCGAKNEGAKNKKRCTNCKGFYNPLLCNRCKEWHDIDDFDKLNYRCKACSAARLRDIRHNDPRYLRDQARRMFLKKFAKEDAAHKAIMKCSMPMLTEEEWKQAYQYFNGCALCNESFIDTRSLVVQPKQGGRYTASNVVPACTTCSEILSTCNVLNSFVHLKQNRFKWPQITQENLEKTMNYLVSKVKK